MSKVLVTVRDNWADEMDVYGWTVRPREEVDDFLEEAEQYFLNGGEPVELYIGTNEEIFYNNFNDIRSVLTIVEITDEQVETLRTLFGSLDQGETSILDMEF